jgi:hypothetical protein
MLEVEEANSSDAGSSAHSVALPRTGHLPTAMKLRSSGTHPGRRLGNHVLLPGPQDHMQVLIVFPAHECDRRHDLEDVTLEGQAKIW